MYSMLSQIFLLPVFDFSTNTTDFQILIYSDLLYIVLKIWDFFDTRPQPKCPKTEKYIFSP